MAEHLRLVIGGHDAALQPDQAIDIELVNPLFNDNVESGTLPFTLPIEGNRNLLKNMEDVKSDVKAMELEHQATVVYADGIPIHHGELVVSEDQELEEQIEVSVNSYVRSLDDLISDMNCQDVAVKDKLQIGECIGDLTPDYQFTVWAYIYLDKAPKDAMDVTADGYYVYENIEHNITSESSGDAVNLPVVGFSVPCTYKEGQNKYTIDHDNDGNPIIEDSYINTSAPYPEAKYCNARICYPHKKINEDGTTSDQIDADNPLFVLDANRPGSGICFYVLYFVSCLFRQLGLIYDESNLTNIEDLCRLAFYTTHCGYDMERKHNDTVFDLNSIEQINSWLGVRDNQNGMRTGAIVSYKENVSAYTEPKEIKRLVFKTRTSDPLHPSQGESITMVAEVGKYLDSLGFGRSGNVTRITSTVKGIVGTTRANIMKMYANSKNFPDTSVSSIINSLWNSFGIKFVLDAEQQKVTPYVIRDVFRDARQPRKLHGTILSITKVVEKTTGVRMRYAAESDPKEQSKNVRDGVRDYDTAFDYLMSASEIDSSKTYGEIIQTQGISNTKCYVDRATGYAYRWKVDGEATTINELNARLFEVGAFKGVEIGDCSKKNEDYIIDLTSDFEPLVMTDTNYKEEKEGVEDSIMSAYADVDMSNENEHCQITYALGTSLVDFPLTIEIRTEENYDPNKTDDGDSPLQTYDWGTSIAVMRGGGSNATIQYYDYNYDGHGNAKYRTISGDYAMTSDSIDHWGNEYDYNADEEGIGEGERFSLKIRSYKQDPETGEILCDDDENIRNRGLFDTFMKEYAHFALERKKFVIRMICEVAEIVDIPNHWDEQYEIGEFTCFINKVKSRVTIDSGLDVVELEVFYL
ncbi:MAG: hypothetical protein IJ557_02695 [Bacteroidaceae bacterium]|nr:hypothetical protein [Bacteroidaceae bacterium]